MLFFVAVEGIVLSVCLSGTSVWLVIQVFFFWQIFLAMFHFGLVCQFNTTKSGQWMDGHINVEQ